MLQTSWSEVDDLVNELESEQRSNDAQLVQSLFDEASYLDDLLDSARETIHEYDSIFDEIIEIVEAKRKNEISKNGSCSKDTQLLVASLRKYLSIRNLPR